MGSVIDRDQRRVWQEERKRRGLVPGQPHFARLGLMSRLDEVRVLVTTLPPDPLSPTLEIDDTALATFVLTQHFTGLTANSLSVLDRLSSTSSSLVRYSDRSSAGAWLAFVALRRDGGGRRGHRFARQAHVRREFPVGGHDGVHAVRAHPRRAGCRGDTDAAE
jgi:hypothetical protein